MSRLGTAVFIGKELTSELLVRVGRGEVGRDGARDERLISSSDSPNTPSTILLAAIIVSSSFMSSFSFSFGSEFFMPPKSTKHLKDASGISCQTFFTGCGDDGTIKPGNPTVDAPQGFLPIIGVFDCCCGDSGLAIAMCTPSFVVVADVDDKDDATGISMSDFFVAVVAAPVEEDR